MSFSSNVKRELSLVENKSPCCRHAMCYGMLLFGKAFSKSLISELSELECVIDRYVGLIESEIGVRPEIKLTTGKKFKVNIEDKDVILRLFDAFSSDPNELKRRINMGNLQNLSTVDEIYNCCNRAFLRGAFLSCGTMTDPEKNYHLEFVVPSKQLSLDLRLLLKDCDISAKTTQRRGVYIVYLKDSTDIENLLNLMGATNAELDFIGVKIQKSVANKINRANNFEYANISRTAGAAAEQINTIEKIKENGTFDLLDDDLRRLAKLRLENPDASLNELAAAFDPPVSRSSVNYKFKKIKSFSKKSREQLLEELQLSGI